MQGRIIQNMTKACAVLVVGLVLTQLTACHLREARNGSVLPKLPLPKTQAKEFNSESAIVSPPPRPVGSAYRGIQQHSFSTVGEDADPDISRDGTQLVFASKAHSPYWNIYIKPVNGRVMTQKTDTQDNDIQPKLSPDGKHVAFASDRNGNYDIFVIGAQISGSIRQVTNSTDDEISPSWSPDGKEVVYCSLSAMSQQWELWKINLETQAKTNLGPGFLPEWGPAGDIVFQRARTRDGMLFSIWTMGKDGSRPTEIISSRDWAAINPAWSPLGDRLVFATVRKSPVAVIENRLTRGDDIWMIKNDGTGLVQITRHAQPDWNPVWGADNRIYFTSERNGQKNIWSVEPLVD